MMALIGIEDQGRAELMDDPELKAMTSIAAALTDLDEDTSGRVLRWAAERYGVSLTPNKFSDIVDHFTGLAYL